MDIDMRPDQPNVSPAQPARNAGEPEGLQKSSLRRAISESSTGVNFGMDESDPNINYPQPPFPQRRVSPKLDTLPRYRWDPKKRELVKISTSGVIPRNSDAAERNEEAENRVEDDATLVPSEDGHINERMETEYFSETGSLDDTHVMVTEN